MVRVHAYVIALPFTPVRPAMRAIITGILIIGNGMRGMSVVTPDTKYMAIHVVDAKIIPFAIQKPKT